FEDRTTATPVSSRCSTSAPPFDLVAHATDASPSRTGVATSSRGDRPVCTKRSAEDRGNGLNGARGEVPYSSFPGISGSQNPVFFAICAILVAFDQTIALSDRKSVVQGKSGALGG